VGECGGPAAGHEALAVVRPRDVVDGANVQGRLMHTYDGDNSSASRRRRRLPRPRPPAFHDTSPVSRDAPPLRGWCSAFM